MMWFFLAAILLPVIIGLLIGRWGVVGLPLVTVPIFYLGLRYGWWGSGVGEAWQFVAALFTVLSMAVTAVAVFLSIMIRRAFHRREATGGAGGAEASKG